MVCLAGQMCMQVRSKIDSKNLLEFVDPQVRATCSSVDHLEKALKLALLCAKQNPVQRPSMYDVAQVLSSLLPTPSPPYKPPPTYPSPASKHHRYIDIYSSNNYKQAEHSIASSSSNTSKNDLLDRFEDIMATSSSSASKGDKLLDQFEDVISRNG